MRLQKFLCWLAILVDFFGVIFCAQLGVRKCHVSGDELLANECVNVANTNLTILNTSMWTRNVSQIYAYSNRIEVFAIDDPEILTHVDISHNQLKQLPVDILSMTNNLIYLNVAHNNIQNISLSSFELSNSLKMLDLSYNKLTNLSKDNFANMEELEKLFLNGNKLTSLPKNIFENCINLERLNLANNVIETLTEGTFNKLVKLRSLDLSGNLLKKLPHLGHMPMLYVLDVSNNNLVFVDVQELPRLFLFILNNNELPNMERSLFPLSVQEKGKVDLRFNRFTSINVTILLEFYDPTLNGVLLDGNPWACDNAICPLVKIFPSARLWFQSDPRCTGPRDMAGKFLDDEEVIRHVCRDNHSVVADQAVVKDDDSYYSSSTTDAIPTDLALSTYTDSTIDDVSGTATNPSSSLSYESTFSSPYTVSTSTEVDLDYSGEIVN